MLINSLANKESLESVARHHCFVHMPCASHLDLHLALPSYTIFWAIEGFFSARMDQGTAVSLAPQSVLVGNPGQNISLTAEPGVLTRLMIISISQTALAQAHDELKRATRKLFKADTTLRSWPVGFGNQERVRDNYLSPVLLRIKAAIDLGTHDNVWLDGQLGVLSERLLLTEHRRITNGNDVPRPRGRSPLSARLVKVRDYIDQRYHQPLRLEQMAQVVYASPYHFLRMFKEAYGQTPHQYLIQRRLDASRNLLETTSLRISEISERVGFQNANGFYKAFKRRYDCSPAAFRESGRQLRPTHFQQDTQFG